MSSKGTMQQQQQQAAKMSTEVFERTEPSCGVSRSGASQRCKFSVQNEPSWWRQLKRSSPEKVGQV